jgi:hypothetical protein
MSAVDAVERLDCASVAGAKLRRAREMGAARGGIVAAGRPFAGL